MYNDCNLVLKCIKCHLIIIDPMPETWKILIQVQTLKTNLEGVGCINSYQWKTAEEDQDIQKNVARTELTEHKGLS